MTNSNSFSTTSSSAAILALMSITLRPDTIMVRGSGSYLWDSNDKQYLDFIQGWAVNALGHCPPQITQALQVQSTQLITPSPALHNQPQLKLAQRLVDLSGLGQVHFSNSGSEANEVAIKLARKWGRLHRPGAFEVVTTHNAFHGRTLAMMAACGKAGWDDLFPPVVPGFKKVPFGDLQAMAAAITDETVALMVEPVQGEAGVIIPPAGYLRGLRELADNAGVLLIVDEVQTGVGRTGRFFAFEHERILPDIVTLGKGLGGGVPVSATIAAPSVCCFSPGDQGGTYNGNPLMTAVALAVTESVSQNAFLNRVEEAGTYLQQLLSDSMPTGAVKAIRRSGLLLGIELNWAGAVVVQQKAMQSGLLVNAARPSTIRLMPALTVEDQHLKEAVETLVHCISLALEQR